MPGGWSAFGSTCPRSSVNGWTPVVLISGKPSSATS